MDRARARADDQGSGGASCARPSPRSSRNRASTWPRRGGTARRISPPASPARYRRRRPEGAPPPRPGPTRPPGVLSSSPAPRTRATTRNPPGGDRPTARASRRMTRSRLAVTPPSRVAPLASVGARRSAYPNRPGVRRTPRRRSTPRVYTPRPVPASARRTGRRRRRRGEGGRWSITSFAQPSGTASTENRGRRTGTTPCSPPRNRRRRT